MIRAEPLRKVLGYNRGGGGGGGSGSWSAVKVSSGPVVGQVLSCSQGMQADTHLIIISCLSASALQC